MSSLPKLTQADVERIAEGRRIGVRCPACGSGAHVEPRPGMMGGQRLAVVCVGIDCQWHCRIDVDDAGHARLVPPDDDVPAASAGDHRQPVAGPRKIAICRYPGCRRRDEVEGGLCPAHRVHAIRAGVAIGGRDGIPLDQWLRQAEQERTAAKAQGSASTAESTAAETATPPPPDEPPDETHQPEPSKEPTVSKPKLCRVGSCERRVESRGLCNLHVQRWIACRRPDLNRWIAVGGPTPTQWRKHPAQTEEGAADQEEQPDAPPRDITETAAPITETPAAMPDPAETMPRTVDFITPPAPTDGSDQILHTLIRKLPDFDPNWDADRQRAWWSAYERITAAWAANITHA